ncbi:MAG: D-glycerate 2-kinase [uncultured Gemmatimonadetes bacterium]|uniref:D-glycerate 2-kinase n=1 Tax=uncultured Gemmatimonadota bacterium TaxID=203437 RepID=A0A6J4L685_9BACT|nr:MAG: D-glycerate 2-kinase [uncultured Gemmatimonadota bacterium]
MSLREDARRILDAAVAAADPRAAVLRALRRDGDTLHAADETVELGRVRVVGAGKAAAAMTRAALEVLGDRVEEGSVSVPHGARAELPGIDVWEAAHPVPDSHGLAGAVAALQVARSAGERDLVLCLLSGGASALWPCPPSGVGLSEMREVTGALLRAGAGIGEINAVRKHLSRIAGGGLARAAYPARVLTLALSDVVGSRLDVIGSGPTVPDPTTFAEAVEVLRRHGVRAPDSVMAHLQQGATGGVPETPKPGDPVFRRASTHVVGSVRDALAGAARAAGELGYRAEVVADNLEGEARDAARGIAALARRRRQENPDAQALLFGGETTVTVRGDGRGGRNQELALALAVEIDGEDGTVAASLGTDGVDGLTPAAGAIVDSGTVARGAEHGHDARAALHRNDSHTFFRATGEAVVTGPTGTNVNDVVLVLLRGTGV